QSQPAPVFRRLGAVEARARASHRAAGGGVSMRTRRPAPARALWSLLLAAAIAVPVRAVACDNARAADRTMAEAQRAADRAQRNAERIAEQARRPAGLAARPAGWAAQHAREQAPRDPQPP